MTITKALFIVAACCALMWGVTACCIKDGEPVPPKINKSDF